MLVLAIAVPLALLAAVIVVFAASRVFDVTVDVIWPPFVQVQWAIPEGRVGAPSTNWDSIFFLTVRTADDSDNVILDSMPDLATTTNAGTYLVTTTFMNITSSGTYDVAIKTQQHITKKLNDIILTKYVVNMLNFTQVDNSPSFGPVRLLAGDINGDGTTPATLGDDVINSIDLSIILGRIDDDDPTGNVIRANLNQDPVVNSVDLSLMLKNLDLEGDK